MQGNWELDGMVEVTTEKKNEDIRMKWDEFQTGQELCKALDASTCDATSPRQRAIVTAT